MENRLLIRMLLIGKTEVGKTSLMLKYTDNIFLSKYVKTIVVDCRSKNNYLIQGKIAKICVFDPPGDDEFSTLTPAYWHFVEIIVFVTAYGDSESLLYAKNFEKIIFDDSKSSALKIVLLNKQDLKESLGKSANEYEEEVKIWADCQKIKFYSCSVKDSFNINEPIDAVVNEFVQNKNLDKKIVCTNKKKTCKCQIF